jgi:hypothetical protein
MQANLDRKKETPEEGIQSETQKNKNGEAKKCRRIPFSP